MGNKNSQYKYIQRQTRLDEKEIKAWHKKFKEEFKRGYITKPELLKIFKDNPRPDCDPTDYVDHVFRVYDTDRNGKIDFPEFLVSLCGTMTGNAEDKVKWLFKVYDINNDGFISRDEALKVAKSALKLEGAHCVDMKAKDIVDYLFAELDKNKDNHLSEEEYVKGCLSSPIIMELVKEA